MAARLLTLAVLYRKTRERAGHYRRCRSSASRRCSLGCWSALSRLQTRSPASLAAMVSADS